MAFVNNAEIIEDGPYEIQAEEKAYTDHDWGYVAVPRDSGEFPGALLIHERRGLNDNMRVLARKIASQGFIALAVDLFGGEAPSPEEEVARAGMLDQEKALGMLRDGAAFLRRSGARKIAVIGWGFGGGMALALSLSGEPLDATVIYYGALQTDPESLRAITWPVLGFFGAKDLVVPLDTVRLFERALAALGIRHEIVIYPHLSHGFAEPVGEDYAPRETKDAWQKTLDFLKRMLAYDV